MDAEPSDAADPEGPWEVTARWLFDLDVYNEWMNEEDYLVSDDEVNVSASCAADHCEVDVCVCVCVCVSLDSQQVDQITTCFVRHMHVGFTLKTGIRRACVRVGEIHVVLDHLCGIQNGQEVLVSMSP